MDFRQPGSLLPFWHVRTQASRKADSCKICGEKRKIPMRMMMLHRENQRAPSIIPGQELPIMRRLSGAETDATSSMKACRRRGHSGQHLFHARKKQHGHAAECIGWYLLACSC